MKESKVINNKYKITQLIGKGGVASVYKAWDIMLHKIVAVKKIYEKYASDARFVDMFRGEAINTAKLEHENIVRVLNFIKENGDYYIIMEYVNGVDLEYLLSKCRKKNIPIPHEIAVHIIAEIIKALDYAHKFKDEISGKPLNIIHRDISPGNIMLYYSGRIKLTDFGIAKAGASEQEDNKMKGKVSYMSPEHTKCKGIDARSDLFCCGLVLYEMLTGEKPYGLGSDMDIWMKAKNAKIDFKKLKTKKVNDKLCDLVKDMLRRKPQERYQSAAEMFIDVKKYLSKFGSKDEMDKVYTDFLQTVLKKEIESSEDQIQNHVSDKSEIIEDVEQVEEKIPEKDEAEKKRKLESAEKEKTVLDFVVNSAKKYKNILVKTTISLFAAFIIFTAVDTYMRLTPLGVKIYNTIRPPALKIDTLPTGAEIKIMNENRENIIEREGYRHTSPVHIEKIPPGTYTLEAFKENYGVITRVITVLEGKRGGRQITIAGANMENQVYTVPFEVIVGIDSVPSGAVLFINGTNVGRTPFTGDLEIGKHSIQLAHEGLETLGEKDTPDTMQMGLCVVDTSKPPAEQEMIDRRFWKINEKKDGEVKKLNITGTFWKHIAFESEPKDASVIITEIDTGKVFKLGQTPVEEARLTVGEYNLEFEKPGYKTWKGTLKVNAQTEAIQDVRLKKYVTVNAIHKNTGKSINADIVISNPQTGAIRGKTPIKAALPLDNVRISLAKEPSYEPINLNRQVRETDSVFNIEMNIKPPHLMLNVQDYTTEEAIDSATVWINGTYWTRTNSSGFASGNIEQVADSYKIEVKSDKHQDHRRIINIDKGQRKQLDVKLGMPRDGKARLEIPEEYSVKAVYIDEKRVELNADNFIKNIERGRRHIELELNGTDKRVSGVFNIVKPENFVILRLEEKSGKIVLKEMAPPGMKVTVTDGTDKTPVRGANIWLEDKLLGETNENGVYFSYLTEPAGEYNLTVIDRGEKISESPLTLKSGETQEINISK